MKIRPLFDRVLVSKQEKQNKSAYGLIIAEESSDQPNIGIIETIGTGIEVNSKLPGKMYVKKGDKIVYSKYAGTDCTLNGKNFILLKQTDILAIIEGDEE